MNTQREQTNGSEHPQPIDYGLTRDETHHGLLQVYGQKFWAKMPNCEDGGGNVPRAFYFRYKQGDWVGFWSGWGFAIYLLLYTLVFAWFAAANPNIRGGTWTWDNPNAYIAFFSAMIFPGFLPCGIIFGIVHSIRESRKQKQPLSANMLAFLKALDGHKQYRAAQHDAEMRKRSYWECLDGYAFERATAEVLNKHQFNPRVTPGSGDGGIDIEVTKNSLKGVVQCKAHVAGAGPHVVRDLYGVIHHCGADFGIIVSRGGFTQGAVEFGRNKPILFLDTSDLIAMQEGRDVLASAFSREDTPNQLQEARAISSSGPAKAETTKEAKQDGGLKPGDFCRFKPNMNSGGGHWHRLLDEGLIDLAPEDIVKGVTLPENGMCYVNKPGKCPVLVTMALVIPEWLEPVSGNFKECEYCGAIDHETSKCPYRGKVPYGRKGDFSWRVEDGKMIPE